MKILVSLVLFLLSFRALCDCNFNKNTTKVISLSGPVTVILEELNLLDNPSISGISIFNPVDHKKLKKKIYPGGIFLAPSSLDDFSKGLVFFDTNRELARMLNQRGDIQKVEISTRNLIPMEVIDLVIKKLRPYLSGCDKKISHLNRKALELQQKILKKIPSGLSAVFYLGQIKNGKKPELVMVKDGIVKLLINEKKIFSYPSDLPYVNWSSLILSRLPKNTLHIGIEDSGQTDKKEVKKSLFLQNFVYPGALVPGLSQLRAFDYWASQFQ